jgi:hypothetical protein
MWRFCWNGCNYFWTKLMFKITRFFSIDVLMLGRERILVLKWLEFESKQYKALEEYDSIKRYK